MSRISAFPDLNLDDGDAVARQIHAALRERDMRGEGAFEVLLHDPADHDPSRPLVILVHPGDMIETEDGWDPEDWAEVKEFCWTNLNKTAQELTFWREEDCDIVILHRSSCSQFEGGCAGSLDYLNSEIEEGWMRGSVLYGDDLDAAGAWIVEHLHVAQRPQIRLAGAYSTPDNGCLTTIGKIVEAVIGEDRILVSDWSPPGNSPDDVWRPGNRVLSFWEAQGDDWRQLPPGNALQASMRIP